jgi:DNA-binding transcriptional LysR family regulator
MFSLERHRRVTQIWDWLPAFRAVAEYRSIQKAASALAISPSALSRSVKLLEEVLGGDLFVRHSGGLSLTPLGEELLTTTRDSMRKIDDCLENKAELLSMTRSVITVGTCSAPSEAALLPTILQSSKDKEVLVRMRQLSPDLGVDELLRGNIDVFITIFSPKNAAEVSVEPLGSISFSVFSGSASKGSIRELGDLAECAFVSLEGEEGWITNLPRKIKLVTDSARSAASAAVALGTYVVLPTLGHAEYSALHHVVALPEPAPIVAVRRKRLAGQSTPALDDLLEQLRKSLS